MNELRKQVRAIVTAVIGEYETRLKEAIEANEGIDLLGLNEKCMSHVDRLDSFLSEFEERNKGKKRRGMFG